MGLVVILKNVNFWYTVSAFERCVYVSDPILSKWPINITISCVDKKCFQNAEYEVYSYASRFYYNQGTISSWILVWYKKMFRIIWKASQIHLPFSPIHLYKARFSLYTSTKTCNSRLNANTNMRIELSSVTSDFF